MYNFVGALDFNLKGGVKIKKKKGFNAWPCLSLAHQARQS